MQLDPLTLALSTAWNAGISADASAMLDGIRALGFQRIELSGVTARLAIGIAEAAAQRGMTIQSLHNPCPWPVDGAGQRLDGITVDTLAAPDAAERALAVARARATIDFARELGARGVVIHLGELAPPVRQRELFDLLWAGRLDEFTARRDWAVAEREARKGPYLRAALDSIRQLGDHAAGAGVALGVETRDGYNEIPSLDEFEEVFAATDGAPVYYWHDVGHAEKQRHLGLATQEDYLGRFAGRLLGVHLHDSILDRDHYAPGQGETDLAGVARLLPETALRTLELGQRASAQDVLSGKEVLRGLGLA